MFVLESGSVVAGRYRLEQPLGEGGMGVVWSATHLVTKRRVALKFLKDRAAGNDVRRSFVREARAACAVSHDGILPVHDVLESDDGEPALVMDLLKGEPLSQHLAREGKLPLLEATKLLLPVFAALGAAHAAGVVHRDIKPDNIFLAEGGVRVLDFGLAKATLIDAGMARSVGARSGEVVGTPRYMSPEQAFGEKDVDQRSDIWALGLVAYECLSGVLPTGFDSLGEILKAILSGKIAPLRQVAPELPREVCDLVDRMLSRERSERPFGLAEVAATFAKAVALEVPVIPPPKRRSSSAAAVAAPMNVSEAPASSDREPTQDSFESDSASRLSRSNRYLFLATAVVAILASVAFFSTREGQPNRVATPALVSGAATDASVVEATATSALRPPSDSELKPFASASAGLVLGSASVSALQDQSARSARPRRNPAERATPYDDPPDLDF